MLVADSVAKYYRKHRVIDNVSLCIKRHEIVGMVGLSGSGKSTLIRLLLALEKPDRGTISLSEKPVIPAPIRHMRWFRRQVQYIPQNPAATLAPHFTVAKILSEPLASLKTCKHKRKERVIQGLEQVGLDSSFASYKPYQLSGGQAQRVAIARAVITSPSFLLADEPVSSLDLELRDTILDLLKRLRKENGLGVLFVTHDLEAASQLCENTLVLHQGKIVETNTTHALLHDPQCTITREMVEAIPKVSA